MTVEEAKRHWREAAERDGGTYRPDLDTCYWCGGNAFVFEFPPLHAGWPLRYQCFGCNGVWLGEDGPDFPRADPGA